MKNIDFEFIKRHKNYDEKIVEIVQKQSKELVESQATKESRKLFNMNRQVGCDLHRLTGFTRLNISKKGILYGKVEPEHYIEDLLIKFFKRRFPLFSIIIASQRGVFILEDKKIVKTKKQLEEVLKIIEAKKKDDPLLKDLGDFDDNMWNDYHESQFIKERRNPKLFLKMVPKKFQKMAFLERESKILNKHQTQLEEYGKTDSC